MELKRYLDKSPDAIIVREKALDKTGGIRGSRVIEVLHKVVGVADYLAWRSRRDFFDEINPQTLKKIVANDPNAEKDVVMNSLTQFVGESSFAHEVSDKGMKVPSVAEGLIFQAHFEVNDSWSMSANKPLVWTTAKAKDSTANDEDRRDRQGACRVQGIPLRLRRFS